jgi:hypothetical protein
LTTSQPLQMHVEHLWPMQCEEGGLYFFMQWDPLLTFLKKEESKKKKTPKCTHQANFRHFTTTNK